MLLDLTKLGYKMPAFIDLTGQKFGRLIVLSKSSTQRNRRWLWNCKCICGNEKLIDGQTLRSGESNSCGCLNDEQKRNICIKRNTTHGLAHNRIYSIWTDMNTRCNNPNCKKYPRYGARGIRVCAEWEKFEQFFADMGHPPSDKHSLDRIDCNGPYTKENCRWVLAVVQQNNRTNNRLITHKGQTNTLQQWSKLTGIPRKTISNRIARGWEVAKALDHF